MIIGLCSVKGSPGVTTTALALAASWPDARPVVVEADPAGGDLAARFRLLPTPGLVSLAAAARRPVADGLLVAHAQALPGGLRAVLGPVDAEQARGALGVLATRGAHALHAAAREAETPVLVDAGRLDPVSPAVPLLRAADTVLVLTRPRGDALAHVATVLGQVPTWTGTPGLVLLGAGYSQAEVSRALQIPVMGALPDDPRGASILCGRSVWRRPHRSPLGRAARRLAHTLLGRAAAGRQPACAPQPGACEDTIVLPRNGVTPP